MTANELIQNRYEALVNAVKSSFSEATAQSVGFSVRILDKVFQGQIPGDISSSIPISQEKIQYAGYTGVAFLGFKLGLAENLSIEDVQSFMTGLTRLRSRSESSLDDFVSDDVAILGVADGLARLTSLQQDSSDMVKWLLGFVDDYSGNKLWSFRMRAVAGDILDRRGRLRIAPNLASVNEAALEVVLRNVWPYAFIGISSIGREVQSQIMRELFVSPMPNSGDLERAAVWLKALDTLIDYTCEALLPTTSDTVRILESVQHSLKRWVWTVKSRRKDAQPTRWLIDNEYDVQALLWAILYPIYRADLVDETYLPNWGFVQPRADLGITKLKLIIEVKFAREPRDFQKFEGEISGDLGLYFKDTNQFDRMIVFVYDDCDTQHIEKYDSLKNALKKRERIEDVIIVRRPGMLPNRHQRNW